MKGIFLDAEDYTLGGIAGPPYFYFENESYSQNGDRVFPTALNIYDVIHRYLTETYNPDGNTGHATALLGASEIGSATNIMSAASYSSNAPHAFHEIVTFKGNTLFRSFNSDPELVTVASSFYKDSEKVTDLLKDPLKSSTEPADYSEFNEAYNSIPFDLSVFTKENRIALNAISYEAIMLDRNLKADSQDFIDCHTLAIKKILNTAKTPDADYSRLDQALETIPEDLSVYTEESAAAVKKAEAEIVRGLPASQQEKVDTMTEGILKAVSELKEKEEITLSMVVLNENLTPTSYDYKIMYTGKKINPVKEIRIGKKVLKEQRDYKLALSGPSCNPGKYTLTIEGCGNYTGHITLDYVIVPEGTEAGARLSKAKGGYNDAVVFWKKVKGASGYSVSYRKSGSDSWSSPVRTTKTSLVKKNLSSGTTYEFRVVPYYKADNIRYVSEKKDRVKVTTLKKVKLTSVKKQSKGKVKVRWDNIKGEKGYEISVSVNKNKTKIVSRFHSEKASSRIIKVKPGKTYYYKVRAFSYAGDKKVYAPWSSVKKYTI